ncbi:MAG: PilZ domain-containing protein [Deltaproteobacteria bacterium]|jgi:DNA-binding NtrC family response regulator|nr:PilZ domain-containing protein [Deltaproteobacteria bacterium]MBT6435755.1 PilZ domain-containing protein [Deltaproteobacteria bacterium]
MSISYMVVADPVPEVANRIAADCGRLTEHTIVTTTGDDTIKAIKRYKPQIVILSLELQSPSITEVAATIRKKVRRCVAIGTYRELSIPTIEKLKKENVVEFVAQPAKRSEIFRIVARRCGVQTRVHPRFEASIEVHRADGVLIGKTRNLSREGMLIRTIHPAVVNQSLFVKLSLPTQELRLRCRILDAEPTSGGGTIARAMFEQVRGPERMTLFRYIDHLDHKGRELR